MLLTITTIHQPATDSGYLVYKHPERVQDFSLAFGKAHIFYPEASAKRCTVALLLDIDSVGLVRGRWSQHGSDTPVYTPFSRPLGPVRIWLSWHSRRFYNNF